MGAQAERSISGRPDIACPTLYSGRARVVYAAHEDGDVGSDAGQTTLGLHLVDDVVDIDRVMKLRSVAQASAHMGKALGTLSHNAISPEYRMCVSDYLFLLVQFRSLLAQQERALEHAGPIARSEWETELLEEAWRQFRPVAAELQEQMEALTNPDYGDPEFRNAYRGYTLPVLTPYMAAAANYRRAWHKPLGYPGDYMLMARFYDQGWHGPDLFSKLMYKSGDELPEAVDEVAVETEPSGLQYFVSVRKRAVVPGSRPVPEPVAAAGE